MVDFWRLVWRRELGMILLVYGVVTVLYGVVNPLFEAPDEHWHYFTVQYVADNGGLPAVGEPYDTWLSQEAAQPPLYYLLTAPLIAGIDTATARDEVWLNPFVWRGSGEAAQYVNNAVHGPAEAWPWRGYALAAHLLRLVSTLMGAGTLVAVFGSGRLVWPDDPWPATLTTALVALLPQFNFLHAAVSNDPLIILLCSVALWQLLWGWTHGFERRQLLLLGVTIGLAALTKNAGVLLLVYGLGFVATVAVREGRYRLLLEGVVILIGTVVLLAGWLWWRNHQLYGDWTATSQFIGIAGGDRGYTLRQVLAETGGLWVSLFAVFGWFNVRGPWWVTWFWQGVVVVSLVGTVQVGWRGRRRGGWPATLPAWLGTGVVLTLLLFGWWLAVYSGLVLFMLKTPAAQGRLLLPAVVPLALGLGYGLTRPQTWAGNLLGRRRWLLPGLALAVTVYCVFGVIRGAYAGPEVITEGEIPATAVGYDVDLGRGVRLLAAVPETAVARGGEWVWLTLYWQGTGAADEEGSEGEDEPVSYVVEAFGREGALVGKSQLYHGGGLYPAALWAPGEVVVERVGVQLAADLQTPVQVGVQVKLAGEAVAVPVMGVKVAPTLVWVETTDQAKPTWAAGVRLVSWTGVAPTVAPGETFTFEVMWQVVADIEREAAVLVHVGAPDEAPLATGDSAPLGGDYPTYLWRAGEVFTDTYQVTMPLDMVDGVYPLRLGFYNREDGVRWSGVGDGAGWAHDTYRVGWVEVVR